MKTRSFTCRMSVAVVLVVLARPAAAQVTTGSILGTVKDAAGAEVPGAVVTITEQGKRTSNTYTTDAGGAYVAPFLIPGTYEWTYEPETTNYSGAYPYGWCLDHGAGPCAQFFGGQTSASPYALMWQWSGDGGATNGIGGFNGDLDMIDAIRQS